MNIHEINPKRTIIALGLFIVLIIIGLLTLKSPKIKYELSPEETLDLVRWDEGYVFPYELEDVLSGVTDTVILIDIRNTFDFSRGNIPGSENITSVKLLDEKNYKRLESLKDEGICVVLYGDSQLQTNGPWLVLRQLGFDNVKSLMGGYNYYQKWKDNLADTYADDEYLLGTARYDYAEEANSAALIDAGSSESKAAPKFTRRKKSSAVEGGC